MKNAWIFCGVYRLSEALSSGVRIYNSVQKKRLMIKIISLRFSFSLPRRSDDSR